MLNFRLLTKSDDEVDPAVAVDTSVYDHYKTGLVAAYEWLRAASQLDGDMDQEEFKSEVHNRYIAALDWVVVIADDRRVRRTDLMSLCQAVDTYPGGSRIACIEQINTRLGQVAYDLNKTFAAARAAAY